MIALVRNLISKRSSFLFKSHVSLSLHLHFFSTSWKTQLVANPRIYDVLVRKHQFSPSVASKVVSDLARFKSPEKADSTLSFLKESGFSSIQLERSVKYSSRILTASVEDDIKFKIKIFQDLGFSPEDIAKIVSSHQVILHLSAKNKIIPQLASLKRLLGSNYDVAGLLRKSPWFLSADLGKTMVPNVEFLMSCGITMERIAVLIRNHARCLLVNPDIMRESVDKAKEMGYSQNSKMFIHAVQVVASMSKKTWEVKSQAFRDLGFLDSDVVAIFRKAPSVFGGFLKKIKKVKELLLATGKFNISDIVNSPISLCFSIEKRYKPRFQILGILESKNLIEKWPSLATVYTLTDDKFFEKFINPYSNEVGKVYVPKSCIKGKREMIL